MRRKADLSLLFWLLAAALLRGLWLHRWSLWGDESHTLSDILDLDGGRLRDSVRFYPLFYLLEWGAMRLLGPWCGPEVYLRLVPAVAGTLAVGAFHRGTRDLLSRGERHFGAMILCFCPWLLFHAQYARFYSLLLLFSVLFTTAFLRALRTQSQRTMAAAVGWAALAVLVHPSASLLFVGLLAAALVRRSVLGQPRAALLRLPLVVVVVGVAAGTFVLADSIRDTIGYKLSLAGRGAGGIVDFAQGVVYNLGLAPSLLALVGFLLLLRRRVGLGIEVGLGVGLPFALLAALSLGGVMIEQRYFTPCLPLLLLPVSMALEQLRTGLSGTVPRPALVVAALVLLPFAPSLASHYLDGDRHDLRSVAHWLGERVSPDDLLVSDYHSLLELYLPDFPAERILEAPPQYEDLEDGMGIYQTEVRTMRRSGRGVVWACVPTTFERQSGNPRAFLRWLRAEGSLQWESGRTRLDYHQNRLEVYRVESPWRRPWRPELREPAPGAAPR